MRILKTLFLCSAFEPNRLLQWTEESIFLLLESFLIPPQPCPYSLLRRKGTSPTIWDLLALCLPGPTSSHLLLIWDMWAFWLCFVSFHFCLHGHGVCMFWSNMMHSWRYECIVRKFLMYRKLSCCWDIFCHFHYDPMHPHVSGWWPHIHSHVSGSDGTAGPPSHWEMNAKHALGHTPYLAIASVMSVEW